MRVACRLGSTRGLACSVFLGSTGCQPVVADNPAGDIFAHAIRGDAYSRSRQAAETCRLAACAPQTRALPKLSSSRSGCFKSPLAFLLPTSLRHLRYRLIQLNLRANLLNLRCLLVKARHDRSYLGLLLHNGRFLFFHLGL